MFQETRQNELRGALDSSLLVDERLSALENKKPNWFGQNPMIVLTGTCSALFAAFWAIYTWSIGELKKDHQIEISKISKNYDARIAWVRDQNKEKISLESDKCELKNSRITIDLESCKKLILKK
mgnify:CR=1 FL=1